MRGHNARAVLQQRRDVSLELVDPYGKIENQAAYAATGDHVAKFCRNEHAQNFAAAKHAVSFAGERATFRKMESKQAADKFGNASLDFVFLDGDHSESGVREDLRLWRPKIVPGGFIGGHDYANERFGVTAAVDAFAETAGLNVETGIDQTWFCRV